jgi:hypothetical protein
MTIKHLTFIFLFIFSATDERFAYYPYPVDYHTRFSSQFFLQNMSSIFQRVRGVFKRNPR